jgi:hypothetical protein
MKYFLCALAIHASLLLANKVVAQCDTPEITGNQILCEGQTITLSAPSGYSSYQWSDGTSDESISVGTTGLYGVTVTCSNGSTSTNVVNVQAFQASFFVAGSGTICLGGCNNVVISGPNGPTGPYQIELGLSTGGTLSFVDPFGGGLAVISLCPTETTTYTLLSLTSPSGCAAIIPPLVSSGTIVVIDPTVNIEGPAFLCTSQTATLTADPGNFQSYNWSNGSSGSAITVSSAGTYSVTVTAFGNCTATASITIPSLPFTPPTITGGGLLCSGSTLQLTVGGSYDSYAWSDGQSEQTITISTSGTYTVTVTSANGCTGTDSETVTFGVPPATSITGPPNICQNAVATLTATGNFPNYQWSSGEMSNSISINSAGTYTVTVTNAAGCTGTASATVNPLPAPAISFTAE